LRLLGGKRRFLAAGLSAGCITLYAVLVGGSASVMRATLMGGLAALLLADGSYAPANPPEWIERLRPQVVLLSVAAGDRRSLPDPETLEAVAAYPLLRTEWNGWIELTTDGEQMWVEVERQKGLVR
jgi:hypothetical protein